jgi:peptidoglycan hydrolase-like protein with peptidoglycan-binding domain
LNVKAAGALLIVGGLCVFLSAGISAQSSKKPLVTKSPTTSHTASHSSTSGKKKGSGKSRASRSRGQAAPTTDRIREIQTALIKADAYNGTATGKWDAATVEAMKKFQQSNGLNPSGKLNALSLEKLGLGSATSGRGAPRLAPAGATSSSPTNPPRSR